MKLYRVIVDDSELAFAWTLAVENKRELAEAVKGNGEILKVTDVTKENSVDIETFQNTLEKADFSDNMKKILTALYAKHLETLK